MSEANGMWEGLMDFSFRRNTTPRMLKFLYAIHLLAGLIAGVAWVVLAFQQAPVQGLLALLGALVGFSLWILYCRVALEVLAAVFQARVHAAHQHAVLQRREAQVQWRQQVGIVHPGHATQRAPAGIGGFSSMAARPQQQFFTRR